MPIEGTFGKILTSLSLMNKDNANNAAAKDRQSSGDAAALERLLKSLGQSKELADLDRQQQRDISDLNRGQRTYESNQDWVRRTEAAMQEREFAREQAEAARQAAAAMAQQQQQHQAQMPGVEAGARVKQASDLRSMDNFRLGVAADELGLPRSVYNRAINPELGKAQTEGLTFDMIQQNPVLALPGVAARLVAEGELGLDGALREKRSPFGDEPKTGKAPAKPLMKLKPQPADRQSITNKILRSLGTMAPNGPMTQ